MIDDESNHAISNLNGDEKDLTDTSEIMNDASEMLNDTRTEDLSKTSSAIDVSSTNEEDDPGKQFLNDSPLRQPILTARFFLFIFKQTSMPTHTIW